MRKPARRRAVTLVEILCLLAGLAGAVAGAVYGWREYGVIGLLLGAPAGLLLGVVGQVALFVGLAVTGVAIWMFCVLVRRGPRAALEALRNGPEFAQGPAFGEVERQGEK